jgi:hypothetical protein
LKFVIENLSWYNAAARLAAEIAFGEKSFFAALGAFPTDDFIFVGRADKIVVMLDNAVAFRASRGRSFGYFRVN